MIIIDTHTNTYIKNIKWIHRDNKAWTNFEIRGGAVPILVHDRYYIWGHTHHNFINPCYMMIVIVLDINLDPVRCTDPINIPIKNQKTYPSGAVYIKQDDMFLVTCGIDDIKQILIHIPKKEIDELLHAI